jgi:hypothetical protein
VQLAAAHRVLPSRTRLVVSVVLRLGTSSAVVTFSYLVPASVTVGVGITPGWPLVAVPTVVVVVVVSGAAAVSGGVAVAAVVVGVVVVVAVASAQRGR